MTRTGDYSTYDFSTFRTDVAAVSSTLDATDPDLDAFPRSEEASSSCSMAGVTWR